MLVSPFGMFLFGLCARDNFVLMLYWCIGLDNFYLNAWVLVLKPGMGSVLAMTRLVGVFVTGSVVDCDCSSLDVTLCSLVMTLRCLLNCRMMILSLLFGLGLRVVLGEWGRASVKLWLILLALRKRMALWAEPASM